VGEPQVHGQRINTLSTAASGTHSPFAALHKSGSYRGVICRAFAIAIPVSFDPLADDVTEQQRVWPLWSTVTLAGLGGLC
jgi:hypothetical protein